MLTWSSKTSSLTWRLLKHFRTMLLLQSAWAMFSACFAFAPTLLLKAILEYVEDPGDTPQNAAWFYVILLFFTQTAQALGDGQALWIGRKICIRLRAIIIGEIYAKALRRKAAAGSDTVLGDKAQDAKDAKPGVLNRILTFGKGKKGDIKPIASSSQPKKDGDKEKDDSQVNTGTIINLMAVDSFKVSEVSAYLHFLWGNVPVQVIVAIILLYKILGLSSIAGIGTMVALLPINIVIARQFSRTQKKIMAATDKRIHTTNEVLQNIRIIKYFAWEERFGGLVNEKRAAELRALRLRYIVWSIAATVWYGAPILITFLSFFIYTVVEKKRLIPSVAFTALSLFSLLRVPLDQLADMLAHVQESRVSVDRVDEFLNEDETEKYDQLKPADSYRDADDNGDLMIGFENATFTWGNKQSAIGTDFSEGFRVVDLSIKFHLGQLNIIAGPTGSGKTSMLMALLGEMTLLKGSVFLPGGYSREDLKSDTTTGLTESVAYCAQQAWLVNDTIKNNILFASPFDATRYKSVIKACALERDLEILEAGDKTLVGEKGITMSGGQKQRISLARALYSNARHVLLDDCLSAVDSHTAKWIFDYCILGPLMLNRTCILVTHNTALTVPAASFIVALDNGKVVAQGSSKEVIASGALGEELLKSNVGSKTHSEVPSRAPSDVGGEEAEGENGHVKTNGKTNGDTNGKDKTAANGDSADPLAEAKAVGGVKWNIIGLYLKSMGPWYYWVVAMVLFVLQQLGTLATSIWIREWYVQYFLFDNSC
jgi:ABC-type multidrug transport system fused ATPase/permease subunit